MTQGSTFCAGVYVACASEDSEFQVGTVWSKKSISKTNIEAKIFTVSPPAPRCTFDRSGARRVRIFRTSSLPCDAGFDFFGSERAKGSRKTHQELAADLESREGFEVLAHRPCPTTQGSIYAARSARRVREKARGAGRGARGIEFSGWRGDQSKTGKSEKGAPIWSPLDRMR